MHDNVCTMSVGRKDCSRTIYLDRCLLACRRFTVRFRHIFQEHIANCLDQLIDLVCNVSLCDYIRTFCCHFEAIRWNIQLIRCPVYVDLEVAPQLRQSRGVQHASEVLQVVHLAGFRFHPMFFRVVAVFVVFRVAVITL